MKKLLLLLIPLLFLVSCNEKSTVTEEPYVLSGKITEPITVTANKDRSPIPQAWAKGIFA